MIVWLPILWVVYFLLSSSTSCFILRYFAYDNALSSTATGTRKQILFEYQERNWSQTFCYWRRNFVLFHFQVDKVLHQYFSSLHSSFLDIKNLYPQMKDYLKYIREIVERYPLTIRIHWPFPFLSIEYDQDSNLHAELYILNGYAVQIRLYNSMSPVSVFWPLDDESPYIPNYSESILVYIYEIVCFSCYLLYLQDNATKKELMVRKVVLPVYTIHNKEDSTSGTLQKDLRYSFAMLTSLSPSRQYRLEVCSLLFQVAILSSCMAQSMLPNLKSTIVSILFLLSVSTRNHTTFNLVIYMRYLLRIVKWVIALYLGI